MRVEDLGYAEKHVHVPRSLAICITDQELAEATAKEHSILGAIGIVSKELKPVRAGSDYAEFRVVFTVAKEPSSERRGE
jgi:hypothetical protein